MYWTPERGNFVFFASNLTEFFRGEKTLWEIAIEERDNQEKANKQGRYKIDLLILLHRKNKPI